MISIKSYFLKKRKKITIYFLPFSPSSFSPYCSSWYTKKVKSSDKSWELFCLQASRPTYTVDWNVKKNCLHELITYLNLVHFLITSSILPSIYNFRENSCDFSPLCTGHIPIPNIASYAATLLVPPPSITNSHITTEVGPSRRQVNSGNQNHNNRSHNNRDRKGQWWGL